MSKKLVWLFENKNINLSVVKREKVNNTKLYESMGLSMSKDSNETILLEGDVAEFLDSNSLNENDRWYNKDAYLEEVKSLQPWIQEGRLFGALDHDEDYLVKMKEVSHMVTKLYYDEESKKVKIIIKLIPTIIGGGCDAIAIVNSGGKLSISARAVGYYDEDSKEATIDTIFTYDIVSTPGFSFAKLNVLKQDNNTTVVEMTESEKSNVIEILKQRKETAMKNNGKKITLNLNESVYVSKDRWALQKYNRSKKQVANFDKMLEKATNAGSSIENLLLGLGLEPKEIKLSICADSIDVNAKIKCNSESVLQSSKLKSQDVENVLSGLKIGHMYNDAEHIRTTDSLPVLFSINISLYDENGLEPISNSELDEAHDLMENITIGNKLKIRRKNLNENKTFKNIGELEKAYHPIYLRALDDLELYDDEELSSSEQDEADDLADEMFLKKYGVSYRELFMTLDESENGEPDFKVGYFESKEFGGITVEAGEYEAKFNNEVVELWKGDEKIVEMGQDEFKNSGYVDKTEDLNETDKPHYNKSNTLDRDAALQLFRKGKSVVGVYSDMDSESTLTDESKFKEFEVFALDESKKKKLNESIEFMSITLADLGTEEYGGEDNLETITDVSSLLKEDPDKIVFFNSEDNFKELEILEKKLDFNKPYKKMGNIFLFKYNGIDMAFEYAEGGLSTFFVKASDRSKVEKLNLSESKKLNESMSAEAAFKLAGENSSYAGKLESLITEHYGKELEAKYGSTDFADIHSEIDDDEGFNKFYKNYIKKLVADKVDLSESKKRKLNESNERRGYVGYDYDVKTGKIKRNGEQGVTSEYGIGWYLAFMHDSNLKKTLEDNKIVKFKESPMEFPEDIEEEIKNYLKKQGINESAMKKTKNLSEAKVTLKDTPDGDVEVNYTKEEDGSLRITSAGVVDDVQLPADELEDIGLMDEYLDLLQAHLDAKGSNNDLGESKSEGSSMVVGESYMIKKGDMEAYCEYKGRAGDGFVFDNSGQEIIVSPDEFGKVVSMDESKHSFKNCNEVEDAYHKIMEDVESNKPEWGFEAISDAAHDEFKKKYGIDFDDAVNLFESKEGTLQHGSLKDGSLTVGGLYLINKGNIHDYYKYKGLIGKDYAFEKSGKEVMVSPDEFEKVVALYEGKRLGKRKLNESKDALVTIQNNLDPDSDLYNSMSTHIKGGKADKDDLKTILDSLDPDSDLHNAMKSSLSESEIVEHTTSDKDEENIEDAKNIGKNNMGQDVEGLNESDSKIDNKLVEDMVSNIWDESLVNEAYSELIKDGSAKDVEEKSNQLISYFTKSADKKTLSDWFGLSEAIEDIMPTQEENIKQFQEDADELINETLGGLSESRKNVVKERKPKVGDDIIAFGSIATVLNESKNGKVVQWRDGKSSTLKESDLLPLPKNRVKRIKLNEVKRRLNSIKNDVISRMNESKTFVKADQIKNVEDFKGKVKKLISSELKGLNENRLKDVKLAKSLKESLKISNNKGELIDRSVNLSESKAKSIRRNSTKHIFVLEENLKTLTESHNKLVKKYNEQSAALESLKPMLESINRVGGIERFHVEVEKKLQDMGESISKIKPVTDKIKKEENLNENKISKYIDKSVRAFSSNKPYLHSLSESQIKQIMNSGRDTVNRIETFLGESKNEKITFNRLYEAVEAVDNVLSSMMLID